MSDVVTELVAEQRRRLVGSILGFMEREIYPDLTVQQQVAVRKKVLTSVGVFSDFTLDCIRACNKGWVVNEEAMRLLNAINDQVSADRFKDD